METTKSGLSRRQFLGAAAVAAGTAIVAGCSGNAAETAAPAAESAATTAPAAETAAAGAAAEGYTTESTYEWATAPRAGTEFTPTLKSADTEGLGNSTDPMVLSDAKITPFEGGRRRPEALSREHPLPMETGYVGPNARPILPVDAPASWTAEADVVVVGSGYGGLSAAAYAARNGYSAILLEKNQEIGGTSQHAAINMCVAGGAKEQIELGYFWPNDTFSINQAVNKLNNEYNDSIDLALLTATVIANPVWIDWMQEEMKVGWECIGSLYWRPEIGRKETTTVIGNRPTCEILAANAEADGAQILLKHQVTNLVVEDNRVVGVRALTADGTEEFYKGTQGVILTAGHFGMNFDLLEQYCPSAYREAATGGPMPWTTGECFRMGLGVGADVSGFDSWCCWDGAADEFWNSGSGNWWNYFWSGERQLAKNPWLLLNKAGDRIPYYAADFVAGTIQPGYDVDTYSMGDLTNSAAWMATIGNRNYCIFDDNYEENVFSFESAHTAADEGRIPVHPGDGTPEQLYCTQDWQSEFEGAIAQGSVFKADTIAELAEMVGLPVDKTVAQVEKWNEIVASGDDSEFTPAYLPDWLVPISTPPFYCIPCSGQIGKIMCGLRVNDKMQVITPQGNPIAGLYAGWFTAGGICGESSYGGVFGNPTLAGGVAISGVGGLMAVRAALGNPITYDDLCDEAKALDQADREAQSAAYLKKAADGSYMPVVQSQDHV
ncbi:FAD-dependent oxidoreductase [Slackia heliotrinireducens]|uniref:FAD-dependent oxidoreductase n=1 Tax=Slackia heliotrinireducens TaxID=84110 RepID=UPI0033148958